MMVYFYLEVTQNKVKVVSVSQKMLTKYEKKETGIMLKNC